MADLTFTTAYPAPFHATWLARVTGRIHAAALRMETHKARKEIAGLSDHMLKDIGVTRDETIPQVDAATALHLKALRNRAPY